MVIIGLVTLNWTVFKRTVTIENQEMRKPGMARDRSNWFNYY